jgi:4-amino-4-deoxy-L-arabinose transferase-like glycosyltransferase
MENIQKAIITYFAASYLIFLTACLQGISSLSLAAIAIGSLLLILPIRRLPLDTQPWNPPTPAEKKIVAIALLAIMIVFAHVMIIPPYMRDDVIYHLMVPKQLFMDGGFRFDPFNINANFPMAFELPLTLFYLFKGWVPPFLMNYLVLLCLCCAFYLMARRVFHVHHGLAIAAVLLIATTPVIYDQVHSCYVEISMSLLVLVVFYNYCLFLEHRNQSRYWYLAMLFTGFLCATKYMGGVYALFLLAVEFIISRNRSQFYKGALICIAVCLPWYVKNWIWLGNPVFPLLNFLFQSEYVTVDRSIYYTHLFADYNAGKALIDYLLLPFRLLAGYDVLPQAGRMGFGGKLSFFFICSFASVAAIFKKGGLSRTIDKRAIIGLFFIIYAFIWAFTSQQVRFLLPVLILASLCGLSLLSAYWMRFRIPVLIVMGLILLQNSANIFTAMKTEKIAALISGQITREDFLNYHMPVSYELAQKLNRMLDPQKAKLFAIGNFGRNYYYDMPVITNTYYEAEILSRAFQKKHLHPELFEEFLKKHGITHMLVNYSYLKQFYAYNPTIAMDRLKNYLNHFKPILTQKAVVVYQIES